MSSRITAPAALVLVLASAACGVGGPSAARFMEMGQQSITEAKSATGKAATEAKLKGAVIQLLNAVQKDPKSGKARFLLGQAYEMQIEWADPAGRGPLVIEALDAYVRAADLQPGDAESQLKAGEFLLLVRKFEDARTRAEAAIAADPSSTRARLLKGSALAGLRDMESAMATVEEAVKLSPGESSPLLQMAVLYMGQGRAEEGEAAIRKALEVDPNSVEAHQALALVYASTSRNQQAEEELKRAVAIDPKNVAAQRLLTRYYLESGRTKDAETPIKAIAQFGKDSASKFTLADYYAQTRRWADAQAVLEPLAKDTDTLVAGDARTRLAGVAFAQGKLAEARKGLDEVLAKSPKHVEAHVFKARLILEEMRQLKGDDPKAAELQKAALAEAQVAVTSDPRSPSAHYLQGIIRRQIGDVDGAIQSFNEVQKLRTRIADRADKGSAVAQPQLAGVQFLLADLFLRKDDAVTAADLARDAVSNAPGSLSARVVLVRALLRKGELDRAESELKLLVGAVPNSTFVRTEMGNLLVARKDIAGARKEFQKALELSPANHQAVAGMLDVLLAEHRNAEAVTMATERAAKFANVALVQRLAAEACRRTGDPKTEETFLRKAIALEPDNASTYLTLASSLKRQNRLDDARTQFEASAKKDSAGKATALTMVGIILELQHKTADARKKYEEVLTSGAKSAVAANNLAMIYAESGTNLDTALEYAQMATQLRPDSGDFSDTLGWVYLKKDLASLAVSAFQGAIKQDPKNATYHLHLGMAYFDIGDYTKAKDALDQALKFRPELDEARDWLRKIPS